MRYWEIIADNLSQAGFSWDCVSVATSPAEILFGEFSSPHIGGNFVPAQGTVALHRPVASANQICPNRD